MKNKIIKLSIFLLIATFMVTGCKIQSAKEYNNENSSKLDEIEKVVDRSKDIPDRDSTKEKDNEITESKSIDEAGDKKPDGRDNADKDKEKSNSNTNNKDISKTSNSSKDKTKKQDIQGSKVESISKDKPIERPQEKPKPQKQYTTIEIRVDEILKNYDKLDPKLQSTKFVPSNGVILGKSKFELQDGQTVFDILVKATRQNRIHMEYQGSSKSQYGSAYIKGINNIYEFSCGELSGWRYKVNGTYPNVGVSSYKLKDGDNISINYTCNLARN